ncbi:19591_t:CDS:2 [Entrophospora sp. SA101]|nr:8412_t:CDS:2 [Entrophospora sp. SA101]CAJ0644811.1 14091_t:CDS:2 [Entrophospora sp. SA101]CAJ0755617.1 19591_t:CDS:2 [Entrophospora sp. SA101]CAJ0840605.1 6683_t:CDS:2 [Entrophospora sp. SA101]CAJ0911858.1 7850_t:CDS:2 [Entrophospora sp. SA101]
MTTTTTSSIPNIVLVDDYPPLNLSNENLEQLKKLAIDWSLSHGLNIRPKNFNQQQSSSSVLHAPISLLPTPFPRKQFDLVVELQPLFNILYHKLSNDHQLISNVIEEISNVDDFIAKLYDIYLKIRKEGNIQPITLGIHRSDYLLHSSSLPNNEELKILQVEFNTISSALTRISVAHELYGSENSVVLMVVQSDEWNIFDQRWIEYNLLKNHKIDLIRKTLLEIFLEGKLNEKTKALIINGKEVSVTYFRAGYRPGDYPSENEWNARLMIERSKSIKCPSISYQLVGFKVFQQVLARPNIVEKYIKNPIDAKKIRSCFANLYQFHSNNDIFKSVIDNPNDYVMKPQREGGGNNLYGEEMVNTIKKLKSSSVSSSQELKKYIIMDLIKPPAISNILLRKGELIKCKIISELGTFGVFISKKIKDDDDDGEEIIVNECIGNVLRSKSSEIKEGGVAIGLAVIDSPLLI